MIFALQIVAQLLGFGGVSIFASATPQRQNAGSVHSGDEDADAQLMLGFQKGQRSCFDQLFQKYKRPVINFAYRFTGRQDRAEELAQEIFVKCFSAKESYRPEAKFSTWLFRIARNHCLNEVRKPEYRHQVSEYSEQEKVSPIASKAVTPEAALAARELQRALRVALSALPERQRTALILSRFHHMSYDEIAATMKVSLSAVKSLLNRAKEFMVTEVQKHGVRHDL